MKGNMLSRMLVICLGKLGRKSMMYRDHNMENYAAICNIYCNTECLEYGKETGMKNMYGRMLGV
jgi:hypothetical protein